MNNENGRVAHCVKHLVENEDVLKEAVREQVRLCNGGRGEEDDLAFLHGRNSGECCSRHQVQGGISEIIRHAWHTGRHSKCRLSPF